MSANSPLLINAETSDEEQRDADTSVLPDTTGDEAAVAPSPPPAAAPAEATPSAPRIPYILGATLFITSFVQYAAMASLSLFVWLDLKYPPVELQTFYMYLGWSAWLSPVVGWLSDSRLVIRGERRRPCVVLGVALNVVMWLVIYLFGEEMNMTQFVLTCVAQVVAQMLVSVPINALVVECAIDGSSDQIGKIQSLAMVQRTAGSLVAAIGQTFLFVFVETRTMLLLCACLYLVVLVPFFLDKQGALYSDAIPANYFTSTTSQSLLIDEEDGMFDVAQGDNREDEDENNGEGSSKAHQPSPISPCARVLCGIAAPFHGVYCKWRQMLETMNDKCAGNNRRENKMSVIQFVLVLAFVFLYSSMPDGSVVYGEYIGVHFGFPKWFLSLNMATGLVGSIVGSWAYARTIARFSPQPFLLFCAGCFCSAIGYGTNIMFATGLTRNVMHIPNELFIIVDSLIVNFFSRMAFMPVLHVAAERCPKGFEAFVYELFSIATLGASSLSAIVTARIVAALGITYTNYDQLWFFLTICAAGKLFPIFFGAAMLPSVRKHRNNSNKSVEKQGLLDDELSDKEDE